MQPAEKKKMEKGTEEGKKPEEEKKEEAKQDEKPAEGKKEEKKGEGKEEAPAPSPPPPEIILKVYMHCEGCARRVRRCLKGFEGIKSFRRDFLCSLLGFSNRYVCFTAVGVVGVEDVMTDCKSHKVVVKGEKADPMKVLQRVQRKSHRQVELISPIRKPLAEEGKKDEEKEKPKPEEKKEEVLAFFFYFFLCFAPSLIRQFIYEINGIWFPAAQPPQVITVVLKVHMHCEACAQHIKKGIQKMKGVTLICLDSRFTQLG